MEVLDSFFGNVCELDLVFNFYKVGERFCWWEGVETEGGGGKDEANMMQVYAILDEVFLAGEIEETSKQVVLTRLEHLDKLE